MDAGRLLIILGVLLVAGGVLIKLGVPLGRLPGDIVIRGERSSFYFPLVTCLVISVVLSVIGWMLRK
jgi:hypothetical protein